MKELKLQGLGPLGPPDGSIEVAPLTILIGKNGCGKSYTGMTFHSLFASEPSERVSRATNELPEEFDETLHEKLDNIYSELINTGEADIDNSIFNKILDKYYENIFVQSIEEKLRETFATELSDILSVNRDKIVIQFDTEFGPLKMGYFEGWGELRIDKSPNIKESIVINAVSLDSSEELKAIEKNDERVRFNIIENYLNLANPFSSDDGSSEKKINDLIRALMLSVEFIHFENAYEDCYYLPAPRAGFLESHDILAAGAFNIVSNAGIEEIQVPEFSGAVSSYLTQVASISQSDEKTELSDLAENFEKEVMGGKVKVSPSDDEPQPDITFNQYGEEFPFYLTSTGMSEIAPLTLFTKYKLEQYSTIVIEEPEAHLHPENQKKVAQFITKLINNGVRVIVTTHSDFFIEQLSNLVRLSGVSEESIKQSGLEDLPPLEPEDVSINMFYHDEGPEYLPESLEVNQFEGIPMDQFEKVGNELYGQTHKIANLVNKEQM
jgi:predicted ATPase